MKPTENEKPVARPFGLEFLQPVPEKSTGGDATLITDVATEPELHIRDF